MARIKIENIGPINFVEIELNKINVIIGPQSSGKSTIAKIISYCQWVEKRHILDGGFKYDVKVQLLEFHRLGKVYFNDNSVFEYESDFIKICYKGKNLEQFITDKDDKLNYKNTKHIYIPSERNFVSSIPNLSKYKESNDNIMSFVYDWYTAKRKFTKQNSQPILNLGINFYNGEEKDSDILILDQNKKEIQLIESSSGLQSVTPLFIVFEYLTELLFDENRFSSIEDRDSIKRQEIMNNLVDVFISNKIKISPNEKGGIELSKDQLETLAQFIQSRVEYHQSNFIIEEPEQNLFPETQRDLIYYLFGKLKSNKNHSITITTHSPYILYAINNCIMANIVKDKMKQSDKDKLKCLASDINPKLISVYQIANGQIKSIQKDDRLISDNYFDNKMKELMDDFYNMLNYY